MATEYRKHVAGVKTNEDLQYLIKEAILRRSKLKETRVDENNNDPTNPLHELPLDAAKVLQDASSTSKIVSIDLIRTLEVVLPEPEQQQRLEKGLRRTELVFSTPPPEEPTPEQIQHRKRMERLRLKQEEKNYGNITRNVGSKMQEDDHVTTQSMLYASSIGLNMIVAPLSFGCFMYFFGGALLDYVFPPAVDSTVPDIRRVLIGVISGVIMLFIEMILFVIRTNELDRHVRMKQRKQKPMPFGQYSSKSKRTYKED